MEPTIDNKLNYTVAKTSYVDSKEDLSRNALLMIKGLLMEFFALLLRNGSESAPTSFSGQGNLRRYSMIKPALRCIKNEYRRGLTSEELAQLCNVGKQHFCRTFKSVTGQPPMEYLRLFRLRVAHVLLSNTEF